MRKAYNTLQEEQIPDIYYLTKEEIGIPADGMVDGVHSTDLGMQQYADSYLKRYGKYYMKRMKVPLHVFHANNKEIPMIGTRVMKKSLN